MPALPKRKISKARGAKRHANWKLRFKQLSVCPQCGEPVRPHHVCLSCGTYRGKAVLEVEE